MAVELTPSSDAWQRPSAAADSSPATILYASQAGHATFDVGEGGGNPFASALIELLERSSLTMAELYSEIVPLTAQKSQGRQVPDVPTEAPSPSLHVKPVPAGAKRVALVFVYSDYHRIGAPSLPGAARDLQRVSAALGLAGFELRTAIDPARTDLAALLDEFSQACEDAEMAVIYVTGHGLQQLQHVYLLPNEHEVREMKSRLSELAIPVSSLTAYMKGSHAHLVFFGGCRTRA